MDKALLNKVNITNCFDKVFYEKGEWIRDLKSSRCSPVNNKYMCKEFIMRNNKIPFGWFKNEDDERYYCIEVRHARNEFKSDTFFEMKNHCLDQKRYFFMLHLAKCFDCILDLRDDLYKHEEDNLPFISFIVDKVLSVYKTIECFLYHMSVKETQVNFRLYEHVEYFIKNRNVELKEYLMYLSVKNDIKRHNDTYVHYHHYQRGDDYCDDMYEFIEHKVRLLGMFISDFNKIFNMFIKSKIHLSFLY